MNPHDRRIIHSSQESDWRTPPECFQALDVEFSFQLDAAADEASCLVFHAGIIGRTPSYLGPGCPLGENALAVPWAPQRIFLNPPFSREKARAWNGPARENPYRIEHWAKKCWEESQRGCTIVGLFPFAPQTSWYRCYVYGHTKDGQWSGHAAKEERRIPHRISFLSPDGTPSGNAGVNTAVIVWTPMTGAVGPWTPHQWYWSWK